MLTHNFDKLYKNAKAFSKAFKKMQMKSANDAADIIAIHAQDNIIQPGGYGAPVDSKRITSRSGRTARSLMPQMGSFMPGGGKREQIRKITVSGQTVSLVFGSSVPYLPTHEYGADIKAFEMVVTPKMSSYFWAKFYETGDDKFKAMALSKTINMPAKTIGKRQVLAPAVNASITQIEKKVQHNMEELVWGQAN